MLWVYFWCLGYESLCVYILVIYSTWCYLVWCFYLLLNFNYAVLGWDALLLDWWCVVFAFVWDCFGYCVVGVLLYFVLLVCLGVCVLLFCLINLRFDWCLVATLVRITCCWVWLLLLYLRVAKLLLVLIDVCLLFEWLLQIACGCFREFLFGWFVLKLC